MTLQANKCVILGIDSGAVSGWAIFISDTFVESGVATTCEQRYSIIAQARLYADRYKIPLIVGREEWRPGWAPGKRSFKSIIGTGVEWGRWAGMLEYHELPENQVFAVNPDEWRSSILELKRGRYIREQAKQAAIAYCQARHWYNTGSANIDHNQAEATLVAWYMALDNRVADRLRIIAKKKGK